MSRKIVYIALLTAMASILFSLESMIPLPLPFMRIGLANIITLLALRWWGFREGLLITVCRVFIGGFLSGRFMQPLFFMALAGGIGSTMMMWLVLHYLRQFSLVGVSIIGALMKNAIQLLIAGLILIRQMAFLSVLPLFLVSSLISGVIIGFLTLWLDKRLRFLVTARNDHF